MEVITSLDQIAPGQRAVVQALNIREEMYRRLLDMGITRGTEVECVGCSPSGDPAAFCVRGGVIALRREDCRGILVAME